VLDENDGAPNDQPPDSGSGDPTAGTSGQEGAGAGVGTGARGSGAADLSSLTEEQIGALPAEVQDRVRGFHTDYTQKTQALAEERRALEAATEELEARYGRFLTEDDQPDGAGIPDPNAAGKLTITAERANELWEQADEPTKAAFQLMYGMAQRVQQLEQTLARHTESFANSSIEQAFTRLHAAHGDFDEDAVLKTADKMGLTDLDAAYKIVHFDTAEQRGRTSVQEEIRRKQVAAGPGGAAGGGGKAPVRAKTAMEAILATIEGK